MGPVSIFESLEKGLVVLNGDQSPCVSTPENASILLSGKQPNTGPFRSQLLHLCKSLTLDSAEVLHTSHDHVVLQWKPASLVSQQLVDGPYRFSYFIEIQKVRGRCLHPDCVPAGATVQISPERFLVQLRRIRLEALNSAVDAPSHTPHRLIMHGASCQHSRSNRRPICGRLG